MGLGHHRRGKLSSSSGRQDGMGSNTGTLELDCGNLNPGITAS